MSELPENEYLTRAWLEKNGWAPTNTVPLFLGDPGCIDAEVFVTRNKKENYENNQIQRKRHKDRRVA